MADFDPALRPIETQPLRPLHERQRRGNERAFDLERELSERSRSRPEEPAEPSEPVPEHEDAPVAPRAEDEAGGRLDVTA